MINEDIYFNMLFCLNLPFGQLVLKNKMKSKVSDKSQVCFLKFKLEKTSIS